jgi:hypothetical protein
MGLRGRLPCRGAARARVPTTCDASSGTISYFRECSLWGNALMGSTPAVSARVDKEIKILLQRQRQGEQIHSVPATEKELAGDEDSLLSCFDNLLWRKNRESA